jgi:serine/threonine protein kinase
MPISSDSQDDSADSDPRIVAAVKAFMAQLDAGQSPSLSGYLAEHADVADQLRPALEGLAMVHRGAGRPSKLEPSAVAEVEFTAKPIGDFKIVKEIGRGGMGIVYEAVQLSLGRRVALKVLPFASGLDPIRLQRFRNEAHAAAQLHHTHIVPVYAVGSDRGVQYYAMQLIDGESLAELIDDLRRANSSDLPYVGAPLRETESIVGQRPAASQPQPLPGAAQAISTRAQAISAHARDTQQESRSRTNSRRTNAAQRSSHYRSMALLAYQATLALEHAHQYGVVHRDIKPGNLLLDSMGKLWVTDFGLAQIEHAEGQLTRSGDALGTVRYMSPEQAAGNRVVLDHRTDIYSLGITLYEMLTLQPAIRGNDYRAMLNQVAEQDPIPPKSIDPSLPIELDTIVRKAIAKDPTQRYATALAFGNDLKAWLDDLPIAAKPPTAWQWLGKWRKRNSLLVNVAVALLVIGSIGMLVTTLMVLNEQQRTKLALESESRQRAAADASFQQARRAVDTFSELSETELAYRPEVQNLRRRILETTLEFYRDFLAQRAGDVSESQELTEASAKVERMVEELKLLDAVAPLLLLADARVQLELGINSVRGRQLQAEIEELQNARASLGAENGLQLTGASTEIASRLRDFVNVVGHSIDVAQMNRLRQIVRQLQLPFTFLTMDVGDALQLTAEQRQQISKIIHEERPNRRGPPGGGPGGGPFGPGFGPPGPPGGFNMQSFSGNNGPPRYDARGGPGPSRQPPGGASEAFGPPGQGPDMQAITRKTVARILTILTPAQRTIWKNLVGKPFDYRPPQFLDNSPPL